jgi:hypothetical protein
VLGIAVTRAYCTVFACAGLVNPCAVYAQITSGGESTLFRSDAAGVRVEPQFEPKPLTIGPWLADIRLTARAVADSNVLRTTTAPTSDTAVTVSPSVRLSGRFDTYNISASARADVKRWAKRVRENSETFDLSLGGRIDLDGSSEATWRTQYAREVEPRGSAGANITTTGPSELGFLQTTLTARSALGRLTVSVATGIAQRKYLALVQPKGAALDQSFRDTRALFVAPRANFALTPATSFFLAGAATKTTSVDRRLMGLRDSVGYTVLAGFRTEATRLIVGEIGVGWRGQNYGNAAFKDFGDLTYDATVDWYPTPLVSVRLQAGQDVVNSGLPQVAGIARRTLRWNTYYDPLRNFRISVEAEHEKDRFREIGLTTNTATATLTGRYQIDRHLSMSSFWRWQNKVTSNTVGAGGFTDFAAGLALTGSL